MSAIKNYAKETIMTLQGEMPVSVALLMLRYRYDNEIVTALYNYAYVHGDKYVARLVTIAYDRFRLRSTGGPVASPGNLPRTPGITTTGMTPEETFADRVKTIMLNAAAKNGQCIESHARGNAGAYVFYVNAEAFCNAMDEMVSTYGQKLKELLGGSLNCLQVTKVCFFIGSVIRMHVINDVNLQTVDILFAFKEFYNLQTVQAKLSDRKAANDNQKLVLGYFEGLLRKYTV